MNILIILSYVLRCFVMSDVRGRDFTWVTNSAGISSQFLQMKIYVNMAQKYHRTSIVPKFSSTHFKGTVLSICDYIQLPSTMRCQTNTDIIRERDCGSVESNGYLDAPLVCYKGPLPLMGKRSSRHAVVAAVEMAPHFELVDRIKRLSLSFLESMGIFPETHLTVVHWRRGDQLSTRCPQRKDKSVNCGTVAQLIEAVTNLNLSTTVYVATNEILSQSSLEQLAAMGFLSFRDGNYTAQSAVDAFMIEVINPITSIARISNVEVYLL